MSLVCFPRQSGQTCVVFLMPFPSESGTYYAPSEGSLEELKEYTRQLPVEDPPETFGLHPNADITFQQVRSSSCQLCHRPNNRLTFIVAKKLAFLGGRGHVPRCLDADCGGAR